MDFIPGNDLATRWLRRKAELTHEKVLAWGDQLLATLEYLHTLTPPIIHRAIKPVNLKLTAEGWLVLLGREIFVAGLAARAKAASIDCVGHGEKEADIEEVIRGALTITAAASPPR